jgi:hypothetical protein
MKRICTLAAVVFALASKSAALAQFVAYEAESVFPEGASQSWERVGTFDATRTLVDGALLIDVDLGVWAPAPGGEQDFYRRSIPEFQGSPFFVQWRCRSTAPNSEITGTGGSVINSSGGASSYHFTITTDVVQFWRDNSLPILYFGIIPNSFHTYRVECNGSATYSVFIDGSMVDSGLPEGPFPNSSARIIWGANMWNTPSINDWDYVRYGVIPPDNSGDFNNNGVVDETDAYFFVDCLLSEPYDAAGPGCKWADMNADGKADGADIRQFISAMTGG